MVRTWGCPRSFWVLFIWFCNIDILAPKYGASSSFVFDFFFSYGWSVIGLDMSFFSYLIGSGHYRRWGILNGEIYLLFMS